MQITFDGACEPRNPGGHLGLGWTVNGVAGHAYVAARPENTNNIAEYRALIHALDVVLDKDAVEDDLVIAGDSQLVIRQLTGQYGIHSPQLQKLHGEVQERLWHIKFWHSVKVAFRWVPREE